MRLRISTEGATLLCARILEARPVVFVVPSSYQGQPVADQTSPIARPSCKYILLTISWSTLYLTRCPRRASSIGGSVVSKPAWTIAFSDAAMVGTGRSSANAISPRVALPPSRRYPIMPARTRLPKALMGSSSHSLHPPGTCVTRLGMTSTLEHPGRESKIQVDVLTIHFAERMSLTSTCASVVLKGGPLAFDNLHPATEQVSVTAGRHRVGTLSRKGR
jgi:hypothetical protein